MYICLCARSSSFCRGQEDYWIRAHSPDLILTSVKLNKENLIQMELEGQKGKLSCLNIPYNPWQTQQEDRYLAFPTGGSIYFNTLAGERKIFSLPSNSLANDILAQLSQ